MRATQPGYPVARSRGGLMLNALFRHRDRFAEQRQTVNEKSNADRRHHRELRPDGLDAAAAIDDLLRKADEVPRWQEERHILHPDRLAIDRRRTAREKLQHD